MNLEKYTEHELRTIIRDYELIVNEKREELIHYYRLLRNAQIKLLALVSKDD